MKKIIFAIFTLALVACHSSEKKTSEYPELPHHALNFIVASDLGRNGYYEQKPIADRMGDYAENIDIEFVAAAGDIHHFNGVESVNDPLWMTNYETIYDHPDLMIDWFAICGNHEYRGNTAAILDYTQISRRWNAPAKYYSRVFKAGDSTLCRLIFIDTSPLIEKYRNNTEKYPDASLQDANRQLEWLDSILVNSNEKWKIVIGHHPVYAETPKDLNEREDMQKYLKPILEKNEVDVYYCGHIHNFQHIKPIGSRVDYVVNSSASLARKVKPIDGTKFCSDQVGFTICSVTDDTLKFMFIDAENNIIYQYSKPK